MSSFAAYIGMTFDDFVTLSWHIALNKLKSCWGSNRVIEPISLLYNTHRFAVGLRGAMI